MPTRLEYALRARELIDTPDKWTKNASARNQQGVPVPTLHGDACRFCVIGAIDRAIHELNRGNRINFGYERLTMHQIFVVCVPLKNPAGMSTFNDNEDTTHRDVLEAFDRTIAELELE